MYKYVNYSRLVVVAFWAIFFSVCASESVATNTSAEIPPPALIATIKGKSHAPKKYIRVEIKGPEYKKMATNSEGMIITALKPGDYIIIIRERGRQMDFKLTVEENEVTKKEFMLAW